MLARQRQEHILRAVRETGSARIVELMALLGVSDMTIRRDLDRLAQLGLVEKVHGGAVARGPDPGREMAFYTKQHLETAAKRAIAARAAQLIEPGSAIALSAGSTTWAMAPELANVTDLTVVTNSVTVSESIAQHAPGHAVLVTGGMLTPSAALVGPTADAAISSLHLDQLFLGVHGMDHRAGLTTPNVAEAHTNRALMAQATTVVVIADATKWGVVGLASFGELAAADIVITDSRLPEDARQVLREHSQLVIVEIAHHGRSLGAVGTES